MAEENQTNAVINEVEQQKEQKKSPKEGAKFKEQVCPKLPLSYFRRALRTKTEEE